MHTHDPKDWAHVTNAPLWARPFISDAGLGTLSGLTFFHHPFLVTMLPMPQPWAEVREHLQQKMRESENAAREGRWSASVFAYARGYRAGALHDLVFEAGAYDRDPAGLGLCAAAVWRDCENIPQVLGEWVDLFEHINPIHLMDDEERTALDAMDDELTIYRGVCDDGGWSWTLRREVAEFFAKRPMNDSTGAVLNKTIHKSDVQAYFDSRSEDEVLIGLPYRGG